MSHEVGIARVAGVIDVVEARRVAGVIDGIGARRVAGAGRATVVA